MWKQIFFLWKTNGKIIVKKSHNITQSVCVCGVWTINEMCFFLATNENQKRKSKHFIKIIFVLLIIDLHCLDQQFDFLLLVGDRHPSRAL